MQAEIIAVGTELTTGAMLDTNSQWLSLELAAIGVPVKFHTTVADDLEAMASVFRTSIDRCDLILVTGGLGPTLDDLTRQAMALVLGAELVLHQESLDFIRSLFARHKREMPERNRIQAHFPAGSQPLSNPRGTAPGIWAEIPRDAGRTPCFFAAMPGVPHEMKRMFHSEVVPRLPVGSRFIQQARVNCFGVGESMAEQLLGDLTARGRDPEIGITVHEATITLRIVAHGRSAGECRDKIDAAKLAIRERMGEQAFGEEDEELQDVVVGMLKDRGWSLATAEIGTAGLLVKRLGAVGGHVDCYRGGFVAATEATLFQALLAPKGETLSSEPARAAAQLCRQRLDTDFGLSIGAFPPYFPEDKTKDLPKSQIALVGPDITRIVDYTFLGDERLNKSRAVKVALNLLRLHLLRSGCSWEPR